MPCVPHLLVVEFEHVLMECDVIMGFPLQVGSKNAYFDRPPTPSGEELKAQRVTSR